MTALLAPQDLVELGALLAPAAPDAATIQAIRRRFPQLSVTRCDEGDIDSAEPFRRFPQLDLHLVDGRGHCWALTADPDRATGLLLAARRASS